MAGVIFACNEDGVNSLRATSTKLRESSDAIVNLTNNLQSVADEHSETLGPHHASILKVIEDIRSIESKNTAPVHDLCDKLKQVAEIYEQVICNDRIKHSSSQ